MAHTPGPYGVEGGDGYLCIYSAEGTIADIELTRTGCGDNARLLAAAPELLEALRDVLSKLEWFAGHWGFFLGYGDKGSTADAFRVARAAIAKADPRP